MLTPPDAFVNATALVVDALIDGVLAATPHSLTEPQIKWFRDYCDIRFRWFHANRRSWRKWLENRNHRIDPRGQSRVWIRHWLAAYIKHPARFQREEADSLADKP
jgi:hypothetical protein